MNTQTQWYEILRKDGRIQYATKSYGCYFIGGSGFGYGIIDAESITAMDGCPPSDDVHTYVCFDSDTKNVFKAIIDKNYRWNGWEMPYIHIDDVQKLLDYLCKPELECYQYKWDGNDILLTDSYDDNHESRIEPSVIDGETYYYFGGEGFTFEKARFQYEDESE